MNAAGIHRLKRMNEVWAGQKSAPSFEQKRRRRKEKKRPSVDEERLRSMSLAFIREFSAPPGSLKAENRGFLSEHESLEAVHCERKVNIL